MQNVELDELLTDVLSVERFDRLSRALISLVCGVCLVCFVYLVYLDPEYLLFPICN